MKKILTFAATAIILAVSCNKEDEVNICLYNGNSEGQKSVFHATMEGLRPDNPETKVYADEDLKLLWNSDDRISIFNKSTYNSQYVFMGEDGDNAGDFEEVAEDEPGSGSVLEHIYAVYPYSPTNLIDDEGNVLTLNFPAEQLYKEHSFGIGANTMISVTDNNYFAFKNVCGYLQLRLYGEETSVNRIILQGNNGEIISGRAFVSTDIVSNPNIVFDESATDSIAIKSDRLIALGETSSDYTDFIFAIPPTTFTRGFTITVYNDSDGTVFKKATSKSLTISRNKVEKMAPLKVGLVLPSDKYFLTNPGECLISHSDGAAVSASFSFQSYKEFQSEKIPVSVTAQYSLDRESFYSFNDPNMPAELRAMLSSDITFSNTDENFIGIVSLPSQPEQRIFRKELLSGSPDISTLSGSGCSLSPLSGSGSYANLATYSPVEDSFRSISQPQTANCYIIRHPGKYAFPVVYGNSIDYIKATDSNFYNTLSYAPPGDDSFTFLTPFQRYDGEGITNPWMHKDLYESPEVNNNQAADSMVNDYEAVIVWQDVVIENQFIANLFLDNSSVSLGLDGTSNAPYVFFEVPSSSIQEGNVIIAVRKKSEPQTIIWSWHIWVSGENLSVIDVVNIEGQTVRLLSVPLGFNQEGYSYRYFHVKLTQEESGKETVFSVYQAQSAIGNAPYYQWGRKDPLLPSSGIFNLFNKTWSSPSGYLPAPTPTNYKQLNYYRMSSIPDAIQNPHLFHSYSSSDNSNYNWLNKDLLNLWHATNTSSGEEALASEPIKTVYDPCPPGFSVPRKTFATRYTLENTIRYSGGFWYKKYSDDEVGILFPCLSLRRNDYSNLANWGRDAGFWTAVPSEKYRSYEFYYDNYTNPKSLPLTNQNRSCGLLIRPAVN